MADETKENTEDKTKTATTSSDDNIFVTDDNTDYTGFDYITSKSEDYLSMSSNELLVKARSQYDANYDAAIYNAHKFLQSACQHCSSVLDKTTDIIRAKGELLKNGINVFAQTPEPQPEAIGNTALVVPKLIAEEDFKNRYETPMGSESGESSSSSSGGGGSVTGYHGYATGGSGMDVLAPHADIPGDGVERWAPYVCDALVANGLPVNDDLVSRVLRQIDTESSGIPGARQPGDDPDGDGSGPALGLMQCKRATFDEHSFSGHTDIFNGYDNLLAAIHYARETYGDGLSALGNGHGY